MTDNFKYNFYSHQQEIHPTDYINFQVFLMEDNVHCRIISLVIFMLSLSDEFGVHCEYQM